MNRKEIKRLSRELNIPVPEIRRELAEYYDFCECLKAEYAGRYDEKSVERVMSELICRSETCRVPVVRDYYLSDAALFVALYIERHHDIDLPLPAFHTRALELAESMQSKYCYEQDSIAYAILNLADLKDTDEMLKQMKLLENAGNFSDYRLFLYFEEMCIMVALRKYRDSETPWDEKVKIFEYLTRLHEPDLKMDVYRILYELRHDREHIEWTEDGKELAPSNYNPTTGNLLFEEYLVKAYRMRDYTIDTVDPDSSSGLIWVAIAVEYAKWMYLGGFGLIRRNRKKALRILRFAAGVKDEYVSQRAGFILKNLCSE